MRTAESLSNLVRSEECVVETKTDIETVVPIRKSSSEDIQLDKKSRTNPVKLKKIKSLRSRLSLRFRSLRDSHFVLRRRSSLDHPNNFRQDDRHLKFADDLTSDSGPESPKTDIENLPAESKKKKRKLVKRFSLNSFKWKKVKSADDPDVAVTTATQTSPQRANTVERSNSRAPFDRVQKILITISGRKTEPKEKRAFGEILNGLDTGGDQNNPNVNGTVTEPKLNITHSERDTPPSERAPARPNRRTRNSITSTVASPDASPTTEHTRQDTGAVRKSVRTVRLERQVSRDEARGDDDEKFLFMRREISQERGVRFPRPSSFTDSTKLSKGVREEKLNRILDYVNKTCSQNNLNESIVNDNETPLDTPERIKSETSPSLREIRDERRNSSFFHSANSAETGSPVSDAGRRRIKYVGQATFYTDEEKEILEGKRQTFINLSGISEYSFETDYSSESQMPAYGDLVMDPEEAPIMTSGTEKREHLYKILVIGELGAGKTSFIKRYVHQFFSANYRATIGVDFALKVLHWDQNTIVRLQLWDIAGQERFGNMTRVYYKEAVGAFIVFDVTRSGTFDAVSKWKEDLDSKVQLPGGGSIPCILLANKCDQEKQGIVTNPEKMDEYVKENGFSGWFETSAKENINIEEAARSLVSQILLNDKLITQADILDNDRFALGSTSGAQASSTDKKSCFC